MKNHKLLSLSLSHFLEMSIGILTLSLFLLGSTINVNSLPCDDPRCKTGSCNSTGHCICNLPNPSTILDGDRPFLGGRFCDEQMTMCDGTDSFWCGHGGACEEIVQGEIYRCKCQVGYSGEHCDLSGVTCGDIFCFRGASCLVDENYVCECPSDWKGSTDCSLPTTTHTDSISNSVGTREEESDSDTNWIVVVVAILCSVGAVAAAMTYFKKFFSYNDASTVPKFQQLSQMQSHGILDDDYEDDEGDIGARNPMHNDHSHL